MWAVLCARRRVVDPCRRVGWSGGMLRVRLLLAGGGAERPLIVPETETCKKRVKVYKSMTRRQYDKEVCAGTSEFAEYQV